MAHLITISPLLGEIAGTGDFSVLWTIVKIAGVIGVLLTMVAYSVLVERKVSAFIQDRVGPNRVTLPLIGSIPILGPFLAKCGIWQPLADGLKSFLKEDFTPAHVRKVLQSSFRAPMVCGSTGGLRNNHRRNTVMGSLVRRVSYRPEIRP